MRTALASLTALVLLAACSGMAVDTANEASGDIISMDEGSITLDSGGTFVVPEERRYLLNQLNPDEGVTIKYKEVGGEKVVQEIIGAE